jgi:hypothetical protein
MLRDLLVEMGLCKEGVSVDELPFNLGKFVSSQQKLFFLAAPRDGEIAIIAEYELQMYREELIREEARKAKLREKSDLHQ